MVPVDQTIIDNVRGDCERACVATITGIPIGEIPNFSDSDLPHNQWMREWLRTRGFGIIETKRSLTPRDYTWSGLFGLVAIATVPSQMFADCKHAIVVGIHDHPEHEGAVDWFVAHDPNPNNRPYDAVAEHIERLRWVVPHLL